MRKVQSVIDQLKARSPQAIYLFGSHAWGTPTEESDVDVLVVEKTKKNKADRMRDVMKSLDGKVPVDVIVLDPSEVNEAKKWLFMQEIFEKGKLMYGGI